MSGLRCGAQLACISILLGVSLSARSADPNAGDLARCAAIAAPDARLACYDTLAGRPPARVAPALSAPSPAADNSRNFGLTPAQARTAPAPGPSAVQAHVAQIIQSATGYGHPIVVLDNGQTWIFTEAPEDSRLRAGDAVSIKRAALGSFMLMTPSNRSYHVRRLQ